MNKIFKKLFKIDKDKYPYYYCTQPQTALGNHCNYLGAFDCQCLCPYEGCNLQGNKR
jgi:hypothetical protein